MEGLACGVNAFDERGLCFRSRVFLLNKTFIGTLNHQTIIPHTFHDPSFVYVVSVFPFNSLYSRGQQPRPPLLNNFRSSTIDSCRIDTELLFGLKNRILP
jgi:hypothetical protein